MRYLPKLCSGSTGCPPLDGQDGKPDAISMFRAMPMGPDNWSEASLGCCKVFEGLYPS